MFNKFRINIAWPPAIRSIACNIVKNTDIFTPRTFFRRKIILYGVTALTAFPPAKTFFISHNGISSCFVPSIIQQILVYNKPVAYPTDISDVF